MEVFQTRGNPRTDPDHKTQLTWCLWNMAGIWDTFFGCQLMNELKFKKSVSIGWKIVLGHSDAASSSFQLQHSWLWCVYICKHKMFLHEASVPTGKCCRDVVNHYTELEYFGGVTLEASPRLSPLVFYRTSQLCKCYWCGQGLRKVFDHMLCAAVLSSNSS